MIVFYKIILAFGNDKGIDTRVLRSASLKGSGVSATIIFNKYRLISTPEGRAFPVPARIKISSINSMYESELKTKGSIRKNAMTISIGLSEIELDEDLGPQLFEIPENGSLGR